MAAPDPAAAAAPESPAAAAREGTSPAGSAASSPDTVQLLVKALGMLPDEERDQVYVWLLGRSMAGPHGSGPLPGRMHEVSAQLLALQSAGGSPGSQQIGQQIVPVRFAADQHAQLRAWCAEHGFSMATVIRGLVARFLEGQLPARN
jgi:hypothetical protein